METRSIFYGSDFLVRLTNETGWDNPFIIRFWTTRPLSALVVGYDGETYEGCSVDSETGALLVPFDKFVKSHKQGLGTLMMELTLRVPDLLYPDQWEDKVMKPQPVICKNEDEEEFYIALGPKGDEDIVVGASVIAAWKGQKGDTPEIGENGNWWISGVDTEVKADYSSEEALRQSQESARAAAETARANAEATRQSAETTRNNAEATRQTNETERQGAEAQRAQTFTTNEAARQTAFSTAETQRQQTFTQNESGRNTSVQAAAASAQDAAASAANAAEDAAEAAQKLATIQSAIDDLDPSQSTDDAVVALAARQGVLEGDIAALGQELDGVKEKVGGVINIPISNTGYLWKTYDVGDTADSQATSFANYGCVKMSASKGDTFTLTATGGINARAYAFLDSSMEVLKTTTGGTKTNITVTAPEGTAWVIFNNCFLSASGQYTENPSIVKIVEPSFATKEELSDAQDEAVEESKAYTDSFFVSEEDASYDADDATESNKYWNLYGKSVGDTYSGSTKTGSTDNLRLEINVSAGQTIIIKTYTTSNIAGYKRPYCLVNSSDEIVDIYAAQNTSDLTDGYTLNVANNGKLYVTCNADHSSIFSVVIKGAASVVDQKINVAKTDVESQISELSAEVDSKIEDVSSGETNVNGLYLPNKKVWLNGASISQYNGYFEYAMQVLGLTGLNNSVAGNNIFHLAYLLYTNGSSWRETYDLLIVSHIHNYDVFALPSQLANYTPSDYESDSQLGEYFTTNTHVSGTCEPVGNYTVDEMYAIGYDYCIKKWAALNYALKDTNGYDPTLGKPAQMMLYTYWHDGRTTYNTAIRKLAAKWGLPLIKDDENIGFSKNRVHPITGQQVSRLHCNGTPWGSKTETIDGVVYGFHPSGIATTDWNTFVAADADTKLSMMPYIQIKRAAILIDTLKNAIIYPHLEPYD